MGRGNFLFFIFLSIGFRNCIFVVFSFRSIVGLWYIIISISSCSEMFVMVEKRKRGIRDEDGNNECKD